MNQYYDIVGVANKGSGLKEVAENEGVRTIRIDMNRNISPFHDISALYRLYRLFKKEKPFLVHSHTPKAGTLSMLAAKLAGIKNRWHTIAGMPLLEVRGMKRRILNTVERFTYSNATRILPNSKGLYDIILQEQFTTANKLQIIGNGSSNGVNVTYFDPEIFTSENNQQLRQSLNYSKDDIVFIFIGRLVKDKGINELIEAYVKLHQQYSNCKLLLVGLYENKFDPLKAETQHHIDNHEGINFVGRKSDVRPYLAIADILAFPSYREGFPNVVMEAGAMGLPSIVTDINGCNEIITSGQNGIIIPPKNADKLFDAMLLLLQNTNERSKLASNAREIILKNYKQSYLWNEMLKAYKELEHEADV